MKTRNGYDRRICEPQQWSRVVVWTADTAAPGSIMLLLLGLIIGGALSSLATSASWAQEKKPPARTQRDEKSSGTSASENTSTSSRKPSTKRKEESKKQSTGDDGRDVTLSAQDVAAVTEFVRQHQPRLAALLDYLKRHDAKQYQRAINELNRVRKRLESLARRDPELHAVELELWKLQARQRLTAAEAAAAEAKREKLLEQLATLVAQEVDLDLKRIELLRERAAKQLELIDERLKQRRSSRADEVQRRMRQWRAKVEREQSEIKKRSALEGKKPNDEEKK